MPTKRELTLAEDAGCAGLHALIEAIPRDVLDEPGYTDEWSVKDLLVHLGCWQAEAVQVFEQIRMGTYISRRLDIDAMNAEFVLAARSLPPSVVVAQWRAARTRMLQEFDALPEVTRAAEEWFVENGAEHYAEHIPRLREWVDELGARRISS